MYDMHQQLQAIGALQRRLLPRRLPERDGWRLAAHYRVGRWPGGDYYDLLSLPDGRILLVVADASDQGAPSAALVAMTRVVLHACPLSSGVERAPFCPFSQPILQPPHILLGHLNEVIYENSLENQFLTAFCGILDPIDGNLHYANAGHPPPRLYRAARGEVEPLQAAVGLPLGMELHSAYHHRRVEIASGDILVLYSDGLTGAVNGRGQTYGGERLDEAIRAAARHGADGVREAILSDFEDILNESVAVDDVTLLVIERQ